MKKKEPFSFFQRRPSLKVFFKAPTKEKQKEERERKERLL